MKHMKSNKDILVPEEAESGWLGLDLVWDVSWVVREGGMMFFEFLNEVGGKLFW